MISDIRFSKKIPDVESKKRLEPSIPPFGSASEACNLEPPPFLAAVLRGSGRGSVRFITKLKLQNKIKRNKTSKNKMIAGSITRSTRNTRRSIAFDIPNQSLGKRSRSASRSPDKQVRKSRRGLPEEKINVLVMGTGGPTKYTYNDQTLTPKYIEDFVDNQIDIGNQIVILPMPPNESHSILVMVTKSGVKIVDWGGETNRNQKSPKWKNYKNFIDKLEKTYGKENVTYEPNEPESNILACKRHTDNNGQGGCSEYVHNWINTHIGNGKSIIFTFANRRINI